MHKTQAEEMLKETSENLTIGEGVERLKEQLGMDPVLDVDAAIKTANKALDDLQFESDQDDAHQAGKEIVDGIMTSDMDEVNNLDDLEKTLKDTVKQVKAIKAKQKKMMKGQDIPKDIRASIKKDLAKVLGPYEASIRQLKRTIHQLKQAEELKDTMTE